MKVGDLVIRNIDREPEFRKPTAVQQRQKLGHGIVLSKHMTGHPVHPCVSVYYPKVGEIWDIAESLMEVISPSR